MGQQDEIHSSQSFSSHPLLAYRRTDVRAVEKDSEVESHIVINPVACDKINPVTGKIGGKLQSYFPSSRGSLILVK